MLDPFPYSGGLTTCEALWMGVPTVTLPGEIFASRHSPSHLSNVGLGDWAAPDIEGYVALALAKAADAAGAGRTAGRVAGAGQGEPALRCAALRPQPGRCAAHAWHDWCARQ